MLTSRQSHTSGCRSCPVSVLARLSTGKVSLIIFSPQEVLGSNQSLGSLRSCQLCPGSLTIDCNGLGISILKQHLRTRGICRDVRFDAVFRKIPRSLRPINSRILGNLDSILLLLNAPQLSCRGSRNMIQLTLNIVPLSDLCELCGKQVVELTRELLLQLHYECLWKLIRVGELSAEDSENRIDQTSITVGFLRTPAQLGECIQKRSTCRDHATLTSKIRGIRNLTLTILSSNRNLKERRCGHFVLDPEDNGGTGEGIGTRTQSLAS